MWSQSGPRWTLQFICGENVIQPQSGPNLKIFAKQLVDRFFTKCELVLYFQKVFLKDIQHYAGRIFAELQNFFL